MKITHHDLQTEELLDDWWNDAGMKNFSPTANSYRFEASDDVTVVAIQDIGPVNRAPLFRDNEEGATARERVSKILRGFRSDSIFEPIAVVPAKGEHQYKLTHGVHRLYCSIAAGFTHVPTILGFDWDEVRRN